jgi:ZIP family zinc transporter
MDNYTLLIAFALTLFAGLSTGIGGLIAFIVKRNNTSFLSLALGFSAGVMIYVSFMDILPKAHESMLTTISDSRASLYTTLCFFAGIVFIGIIDKLVPSIENPHEIKLIGENGDKGKLLRMGFFTAIAIAVHNFPEGIATFTASMNNLSTGIVIAIAIAIHNIPEGIAISVPVYYATGSKKKALKYSFISGLSEPLGAVIGYLILVNFLNDLVFGIVFAMVAGIMVFISIDELLPAAKEYGKHHLSIYGLILGMAVMAASLLIIN